MHNFIFDCWRSYSVIYIINKEIVFNMPSGNRTGPQGLGPLTGRGLGNCSGNISPNSTTNGRGFGYARGGGRGFGRGGGRGFGGGYDRGGGWGYRYPPVITPEEQTRNLENEKTFLEMRLKEVQAELEKNQSS